MKSQKSFDLVKQLSIPDLFAGVSCQIGSADLPFEQKVEFIDRAAALSYDLFAAIQGTALGITRELWIEHHVEAFHSVYGTQSDSVLLAEEIG